MNRRMSVGFMAIRFLIRAARRPVEADAISADSQGNQKQQPCQRHGAAKVLRERGRVWGISLNCK
jgi:hypothetical protein